MKHLSKFLLAFLFLMSFSFVQAQNENNPWALGVGVNAIDFYPTGEAEPLGDHFEDFFNLSDHWNFIPSVSRLSVGRHIAGGFIIEVGASFNKISKFGDDTERYDDEIYYAFDADALYSFRSGDGWLDPFVGIGAGYFGIAEDGSGSGNGTAGINFWIRDNLALSLQTMYKHPFDDAHSPHFQHMGGIKFSFGGKDTDGDGIYDKNDECPEQAGLEQFNGCPDSDADGIEDRMDDCPQEAGLAELNGCPDTDGDGIANNADDCPEVAGLESMNGCPDTDGDGVRDGDDECPDEAGPAENNGCPWQDKDEDGVLDKDDECPEVAGTAANNGCPEPTVEVINELNEYSRTILFDLDKATIRPESHETLQAIADIMKEYSGTVFHIEGHTDSTGSEAYNEKLSRERAASVKEFLTGAGIPANRLTSEGYGETQPISSNNTAKGRQENRRVEISLDKDKEMREDANTQTDTTNTEE